jgi:hypothetical protein
LKVLLQPEAPWSACGWISTIVDVIDEKTIRVAGIEVARIEQIMNHSICEDDWSFDDVIQTLRQTKQSIEMLSNLHSLGSQFMENYCRCFTGYCFREDFLPARDTLPEIENVKRDMEVVCSSEDTWYQVSKITSSLFTKYLGDCYGTLIGRCFFTATGDYIGLAPTGTQPGDVVSILLGCRHPVVLRPLVAPKSEQAWQVVGVCQVPGLMHGEVIYRDQLPHQFRPVWNIDANEDDAIDNWAVVMYDPDTQDLHTDPAKLLQQAGIKVESYQRKPHRLEVLPETLRETGVDLKTFTLV